MKTSTHLPDALVENVADKISQHRSPKSIVKSLIYLAIAAIAAIIVLTAGLESGGWFSMLLWCILIIAVIMMFVSFFGAKPEYRINGSKIKGYEIFFINPSVSAMTKAIRDRDLKTVRDAMNRSDNGLRLNIAISDDGELCRYQFYKYVPFEYKPESEVLEFDKSLIPFIEEL